MSDEQLAEIFQWLIDQTARVPFGEVSLSLTLHAGQIRQIKKTVSESVKPSGAADVG